MRQSSYRMQCVAVVFSAFEVIELMFGSSFSAGPDALLRGDDRGEEDLKF